MSQIDCAASDYSCVSLWVVGSSSLQKSSATDQPTLYRLIRYESNDHDRSSASRSRARLVRRPSGELQLWRWRPQQSKYDSEDPRAPKSSKKSAENRHRVSWDRLLNTQPTYGSGNPDEAWKLSNKQTHARTNERTNLPRTSIRTLDSG